MKVNDLREQFKAAFEEYVAYRATMMVGKAPNRPPGTMRQCYEHAKEMLDGNMQPTTKYNMVLTRLVKTGDVYLHAKKHGIQSAMMFKLSRE